MAKKVRVYRYCRYIPQTDEIKQSTRMATKEKIKAIGAELIKDSERDIDADLVTDGWTEKNFDPDWQRLTEEEVRRELAALEPKDYPDT
jgi:hypothetical protein